jgi:hypothetical protein
MLRQCHRHIREYKQCDHFSEIEKGGVGFRGDKPYR